MPAALRRRGAPIACGRLLPLLLLLSRLLQLLPPQELGCVTLLAAGKVEVELHCDPIQAEWASSQGAPQTRPRCRRRASAAGGRWHGEQPCLWEQILLGIWGWGGGVGI
jgi:hypothetical protein